MGVINLSSRDYRRISEIAKLTHDVRVLKRAQASLWLSDGDNAYEVANRLLAAPRTIYRWVERFEARGNLPLVDRLADAPRSGRPDTVVQRLDPLLEQLMFVKRPHLHAPTKGNRPAFVFRLCTRQHPLCFS